MQETYNIVWWFSIYWAHQNEPRILSFLGYTGSAHCPLWKDASCWGVSKNNHLCSHCLPLGQRQSLSQPGNRQAPFWGANFLPIISYFCWIYSVLFRDYSFHIQFREGLAVMHGILGSFVGKDGRKVNCGNRECWKWVADRFLWTEFCCRRTPQLLSLPGIIFLAVKVRPKIRAVRNTLDAGIWSPGGEHQSSSFNFEKGFFLAPVLVSCVILGVKYSPSWISCF